VSVCVCVGGWVRIHNSYTMISPELIKIFESKVDTFNEDSNLLTWTPPPPSSLVQWKKSFCYEILLSISNAHFEKLFQLLRSCAYVDEIKNQLIEERRVNNFT
jgi:hypothetical protein